MTDRITKRDFYTAVITLVTDGTMTIDKDAFVDIATNEIALLDKKAAKAKAKAAEKKAEGDALTDAVKAVLTNDYQTIADVAAQIEGDDVTVHKVSYRLTTLVDNGVAEKTQITIPATETSKARKVNAYKLVG